MAPCKSICMDVRVSVALAYTPHAPFSVFYWLFGFLLATFLVKVQPAWTLTLRSLATGFLSTIVWITVASNQLTVSGRVGWYTGTVLCSQLLFRLAWPSADLACMACVCVESFTRARRTHLKCVRFTQGSQSVSRGSGGLHIPRMCDLINFLVYFYLIYWLQWSWVNVTILSPDYLQKKTRTAFGGTLVLCTQCVSVFQLVSRGIAFASPF